MTRAGRWLAVAVAAVVVVAVPYLVSARPVGDPGLAPDEVVAAVAGSSGRQHTGVVESSGTVQVPETDTFETVATLFGESNRLRVWWRDGQTYRVDRIRATGETDLIRTPRGSLRWVYESTRATLAPPSPVRLPDSSDLLPDTLARRVLQGAQGNELRGLPARRIAGREAAGVRLNPSAQQSTIDHADVWADTETGIPLRVEVVARGSDRPVLSTSYERLELEAPAERTLSFARPPGASVDLQTSLDVASSSNRFAPYVAPDELAGLPLRADRPDLPTGAVGVYGRGPTVLLFIPLRGEAARPLREQLGTSPGVREGEAGTAVDLGPISVLVTPSRYRGSGFLLAGTVTPETIDAAADQVSSLRPVFDR